MLYLYKYANLVNYKTKASIFQNSVCHLYVMYQDHMLPYPVRTLKFSCADLSKQLGDTAMVPATDSPGDLSSINERVHELQGYGKS